MIPIVKQVCTEASSVPVDFGFLFSSSAIAREFQVGDRVQFFEHCFGEPRLATATLVQSYFPVMVCDLDARPAKGKDKGYFIQCPNGLQAEYEVILPPIEQVDPFYQAAYPKDGIHRGRVVVNEWAKRNFQLIAQSQVLTPGTVVRICKAEVGLEDDLGRQGIVQPVSEVLELQNQLRVLLQGDACVRRFDRDQLEVVVPEPLQLEQQVVQLVPPKPIQVGDRVRIVGETPEGFVPGNAGVVQRVFVENWQRYAEVAIANPTGGIMISAKLLLDTIEKVDPSVNSNSPELTEAQQQAIATWELQGWTVTQQPDHEQRMPSEIAIQISRQETSPKGIVTVERTLFVAGDGWINTEAQRQTIMSWYNEGWMVVQRPAVHGLPFEIEVELSKTSPQGQLRRRYLLSSIGWAALLSDVRGEKTPEIAPPDLVVIEGAPLERRQQVLLIRRSQLESELKEVKSEQAAAIAAGGMFWPKEWASAGIEDYTVVKKLKQTGFYTKFWYHRLYAPTKLFPAKRTTKDDSGKTNRHHLTKTEYARYRAAKYRYDRMQAIELQLDQVAQAIADIERGKQHRKPSAEGKTAGQHEIWDTRNTYPGAYPHKTFAFIVYRWEMQNNRLQCRSQKRFGEIPVDNSTAIARAYARAEKWLGQQQ